MKNCFVPECRGENMIVVEKEKCIGCGLCARICHEQCISITGVNGKKKVERIEPAVCSTCTQCIAVCPQRALSWNQVSPEPYNRSNLPSAGQLRELFEQRRTIRNFKDKKVDRALIEEIIRISIYAPTNNYKLRAIAVDDPEINKEFDAIVMWFVSLLYNLCYRSDIAFNLISKLIPEINAKNRVKLKRGISKGHTYDSLYATLIFIVGDQRILLSEASAQYALYNMLLYAQTKGLGSRINGGITVTLNRSRRAQKQLGLQKHEHILGTLELGYPAVKFSNKVEGKTMPMQWRGSEQNG
jgi:formate hydrogenlyase subunit 6/NADH:ubiquinone oxidoreductase subunit I